MSRRLLVLAWHNVEPTPFFGGTSPQVARRALERQLGVLRRWTNVVRLGPALADLAAGRPLPPRAVALTFDDGYLDNATVAAPMLRAADMSATFFVVTGFLSGTHRAWWEDVGWAFANATAGGLEWDGATWDVSGAKGRAAAMRAVGEALKTVDSRRRWEAIDELTARLSPAGPAQARLFATWDEARDLVRHGHDIGAHTCGHPILSHEDASAQSRELAESREQLAARFERPVDLLAYPNGQARDYSAETVRLAGDAGFSFAVTTRPRRAGPRTPPLEVPRLVVTPELDLRQVFRKGFRVAGRAVTSWRAPRSRGSDVPTGPAGR